MNLSTRAKKLLKQVKEEGLDVGIAKTFLFAKSSGFPTDYFPEEYSFDIPAGAILNEAVPADFLDSWLSLWPTKAQMTRAVGYPTPYAINGNKPECKKRMLMFLNEWNDRIGIECSLEESLRMITDATIAYLEEKEKQQYNFVKKNHKFIRDLNGSILAEYILSPKVKKDYFHL